MAASPCFSPTNNEGSHSVITFLALLRSNTITLQRIFTLACPRSCSYNTRAMEEPLRILIADDESIIRMDLRQILESMEHEIAGEASDGERALKLARALKPDLCILDIKMFR